MGTNHNEWVPEVGDLVAVRDESRKEWFLRFFHGTKISDGKKRYIAGDSYPSERWLYEWDYCEPAKKHFKFNS